MTSPVQWLSRKAPTRLPVGTMLQCDVSAIEAPTISAAVTIAAGMLVVMDLAFPEVWFPQKTTMPAQPCRSYGRPRRPTLPVVRTVAFADRTTERRANSMGLTGHPFRQTYAVIRDRLDAFKARRCDPPPGNPPARSPSR